MLHALDIASIYACLFLSLLVSASTMAVVWRSNTNEPAAGYWMLAFVLGVVTAALLALQEVLGPFAPALSTAVVIAANLGMIAGFRAFNGYKTPTWPFFGAPLVYLVLAGAAPWLYSDPNMNALVQSLFVIGIAFSNAHLILTGTGNRALPMAVPTSIVLVVHGIIRGFVIFFTLTQPAPVINGRMEAGWWKLFLLEIFFNTTMMAISTVILIKDKAEMRHRIASETDDLTGISNRRAFVKGIHNALPDSGKDAIMAILDIDHFKTINDTYGHDAGDKVLIDFVKTTKLELPTSALMGRMGGEEFAIYLSGEGYDHTAIFERVRRKVEQTSFDYGGSSISFTLSIGFASVETVGRSFDHLFAAADCAMYRAKQDGRNRVLAYKPSMRIREVMDDDLMTGGVFSAPTMISKAV